MTGKKYLICFSLLAFLAGSCRNTQPNMTLTQENYSFDFTAGPPTVVYKTKHNYANKVAVILNAKKTEIVAYPHPRDIANRGLGVKPTPLANGYLLDNQGINENAAFTRYSYAEFASLPKAPSLAELQASIIDKDPFAELCHYGNRNQFTALEQDLNKLITHHQMPCQTSGSPSQPK